VEEADLPEHRPDAPHLKHQPLDGLVARGALARQEHAGLVRQVDEDGSRLEQRQRLPTGAVRVDDGRYLVVRIQ